MHPALKRELLWLSLILAAAVLSIGWLTGFEYGVLDINLHDTYLILDPYTLIIFVFLLTTFFVIGLREIRHRYKRIAPLIILLADTTLLLMLSCFLTYVLYATFVWSSLLQLFVVETGETVHYIPAGHFKGMALLIISLSVIEVLLVVRLVKAVKRRKKD